MQKQINKMHDFGRNDEAEWGVHDGNLIIVKKRYLWITLVCTFSISFCVMFVYEGTRMFVDLSYVLVVGTKIAYIHEMTLPGMQYKLIVNVHSVVAHTHLHIHCFQ